MRKRGIGGWTASLTASFCHFLKSNTLGVLVLSTVHLTEEQNCINMVIIIHLAALYRTALQSVRYVGALHAFCRDQFSHDGQCCDLSSLNCKKKNKKKNKTNQTCEDFIWQRCHLSVTNFVECGCVTACVHPCVSWVETESAACFQSSSYDQSGRGHLAKGTHTHTRRAQKQQM